MNPVTNNEPHLISVWMEVTEIAPSFYGVPNSVVLSTGDTMIRNCLSGEVRLADKDELQQYEITPEIASEYLIDSITANAPFIEAVIKNQVTEITNNGDVEKIKSLDSAFLKADWMKIIEECLELTSEQIKQSPQLFKVRLQEFLIELIKIMNNKTSGSAAEQIVLKRIEKVLTSHDIELGNSLEKLVGLIGRFVDDDTVGSIDKRELRKELKSLSQINLDDLDLETLMETVISKMDKFETLSINTEFEYGENIDKAVQDIVDKYPLPSFELDDLLGT